MDYCKKLVTMEGLHSNTTIGSILFINNMLISGNIIIFLIKKYLKGGEDLSIKAINMSDFSILFSKSNAH